MISKIIEKNGTYFCNNCKMRQPQLKDNCWWCGDYLSNYEEILFKNQRERIMEETYNENNIYGRD